MASKTLHAAFLKEVKALPQFPNLKVLDLSCGDAVLLSELAGLGCQCVGTRYKEGDYILRGVEVHPEVRIEDEIDLSKSLPFEDASFDVVVLQEVIEHLPCHLSIVSELSRVLKPGGTLLLSTPNLHRIHSRFYFFLTGAHKLKRSRLGWDVSREETYAYHYNPIDFPIFHSLLYQVGIQVRRLPSTSMKAPYLFFGIFYLFIYLATAFEFHPRASRGKQFGEGERELLGWMRSASMLFSEQHLIVGEKLRA